MTGRMKEAYESPMIEIVTIEAADILTNSINIGGDPDIDFSGNFGMDSESSGDSDYE
jgi:hypothetical protein